MLDFNNNYNLGIIGNCNYLALIDNKASICWMCWPHFDDNAIFNSLLDDDGGIFA